jgi:hypothetical protein
VRREETRTRDASGGSLCSRKHQLDCGPGGTTPPVPIPRPEKDRSFKKDRGKVVVKETNTRDLKT